MGIVVGSQETEAVADLPLVYVVDDDESMRRALERLLRSAGFGVQLFASSEEFLQRSRPDGACLVTDVRMPGMTGMELQRHLVLAQPELPTILITAHESERARQQALADGAAAFLRKPFDDRQLLEAVGEAIRKPGRRSGNLPSR